MSYVNLEAGARTYIAALRLDPQFAPQDQKFETRAERKVSAYDAMISAEAAVRATLDPKLAALREQGLVRNWDFAAGTGALILNVDDAKAGAAFEALRGINELGRIVRNREVKLDATAPTPVAAPAPGSAPVTEWNVEKIGAKKAWAEGVRGEGVVVGIVDTGVNVEHEGIRKQYRGTNADGTFNHDYNFYDPISNRKDAYDDHSHGSHVAGTSVGGTENRMIGMAPDAKYIATKVFDSRGGGSTAAILKGLSWMLAPTKSDGSGADPSMAPDIVSNSWGNSNGASLTYLDTWKAFEAAGIIPVVAAGNSGPRKDTVGSPGSYKESITVGATDPADKAARFTSRGPSKIKDENGEPLRKPDISAPGVDIISAGKSGNSYVKMSGTSMATPAISGVIALMLSKFPNMTKDQVQEALTSSAIDIDEPGWDISTGHGRVDVEAALQKAAEIAAR